MSTTLQGLDTMSSWQMQRHVRPDRALPPDMNLMVA